VELAICYNTPRQIDTALRGNAAQCAELLQRHGVDAEAVSLQDIVGDWGGWLTAHKPRCVIISAVCVPVAKLRKLVAAHPKVTWVQRIHSNAPFLFSEIGAFGSCCRMLQLCEKWRNLRYSVVNADEARRWTLAGAPRPVLAIPNVYTGAIATEPLDGPAAGDVLHLSAMFALRLLKSPASHVLLAGLLNSRRPCSLHMQLQRHDMPIYPENLRDLAATLGAPLAAEAYRERGAYLDWMRETIHVGLQLSMTESFNYVVMEHMAQGIPCVTSRAIPFCPWQVDDPEDIEAAAELVETILGNYRECSARALDAARDVQALHERQFLAAMGELLGRPIVAHSVADEILRPEPAPAERAPSPAPASPPKAPAPLLAAAGAREAVATAIAANLRVLELLRSAT